MLIVGYCMGIRSERRLCEEVHLNLAYRWFCRLGLDSGVQTTRPFPRTVTDAFVRATPFAICSKPLSSAVSPKAWLEPMGSPWTPA